jgi:hypothetical protein
MIRSTLDCNLSSISRLELAAVCSHDSHYTCGQLIKCLRNIQCHSQFSWNSNLGPGEGSYSEILVWYWGGWRSSLVALRGISSARRLEERKFINSEYISENSSYCASSRGSQEFCVHRVIHKPGASSCSGRVGGSLEPLLHNSAGLPASKISALSRPINSFISHIHLHNCVNYESSLYDNNSNS